MKNLTNEMKGYGLIALGVIGIIMMSIYSIRHVNTQETITLPAEGTTKSFRWHRDSLGKDRNVTEVQIFHVRDSTYRIHIPGVTPIIELEIFMDRPEDETSGFYTSKHQFDKTGEDWTVLISKTTLEVVNWRTDERWKRER